MLFLKKIELVNHENISINREFILERLLFMWLAQVHKSPRFNLNCTLLVTNKLTSGAEGRYPTNEYQEFSRN